MKTSRHATAVTAEASGSFELGDLDVRRLGFGAMRITGVGVWGEPEDPEGVKRVLHRVLDLGVNLIDTADSYGPEVSERLIAETLHPYPEGLVIATKGGFTRSGPGQWDPDGRPDRLLEACEGSLKRLRLETIDLYQLHTIDPDVPLEDSVGAIKDLQDEGKIRYIGVSNVSEEELDIAMEIVDVVSVQNRYNLADRDSEDILDRCEALGIGFIPWFPLAAGRLVGGREALDEFARAHEATAAQIASPGSSSARPSCCRSPGPRASSTSRRMWRRPRSS